MSYYVYIIKSLRDANFYIGISRDPADRLKTHNAGRNKSTANRRPFKLTFQEMVGGLQEAREKEKLLKSYKGVQEKQKIIAEYDC